MRTRKVMILLLALVVGFLCAPREGMAVMREDGFRLTSSQGPKNLDEAILAAGPDERIKVIVTLHSPPDNVIVQVTI